MFIKKYLQIIIVFVSFLNMYPSFCQAANMPAMYVLDLRGIKTLTPEKQYDIQHAAVCIQALVNRDASRVFLVFSDKDLALLKILREKDGLCENWTVKPVANIFKLYDIFKENVKGVVAYDTSADTGVISTSLVASTVAGVENCIALRKDTRPDSIYSFFVNDIKGPKLPVMYDLTGKFTGKGKIWQTDIDSTGSAKCDAYVWAKEKFIKTGKTNSTVVSNTLDLLGLKLFPDKFYRWQLSNLDFGISQKAFCFELSPWLDEPATDDPNQPVGTDGKVFREILDACGKQNKMAKLIKFCGFTNWDVKYSEACGGKHHPVHTEWEAVRVASAYNAYSETDPPAINMVDYVANSSFYYGLKPTLMNRRYIQNPAPTYEKMVERGLIDKKGKVVPGNYIMIGLGDYDQVSWLIYHLSLDIYNNPERGKVYCNWAITPNSMDRGLVAFDYMYRHKTEKDFFLAWDSGAGYLNPTQLYGERDPSGYPSAVKIWQEHCKDYYRYFDYSITGWLLNGFAGKNTIEDVNMYAPFSGDGIGIQYADINTVLVDNIPAQIRGFPDNPQAKDLINEPNGVNFQWQRTVLYTPKQIKDIEDALKNSPNNHRFLDAYSYYYLLRYYLGGKNERRATWINDNIPHVMKAGKIYEAEIEVRNDGWDTWSNDANYSLGHVFITEGKYITDDAFKDIRHSLPDGAKVEPGQSVKIKLKIEAPAANGKYDLYYDLAVNKTEWFRLSNNIEWKKKVFVATDENDIDTDNDGSPDVIEITKGTLFWHPDSK